MWTDYKRCQDCQERFCSLCDVNDASQLRCDECWQAYQDELAEDREPSNIELDEDEDFDDWGGGDE